MARPPVQISPLASGPGPQLPELLPGTHPYCCHWFPLLWQLPNGEIGYSPDGSGTVILGHAITGWTAWINPQQSITSEGATPGNLKLETIPDGIQCLLWFHQKPYRDMHSGNDEYFLPDGTSRQSGSQMSDQAWAQLSRKVIDDTWWPS